MRSKVQIRFHHGKKCENKEKRCWDSVKFNTSTSLHHHHEILPVREQEAHTTSAERITVKMYSTILFSIKCMNYEIFHDKLKKKIRYM